jgi:hypothetical protein
MFPLIVQVNAGTMIGETAITVRKFVQMQTDGAIPFFLGGVIATDAFK